MSLEQEKSKLFITELRKISPCDYALRFGGPSHYWQELCDELKEAMKDGYDVHYDKYELDGRGGWVVDENILMYTVKDFIGPKLLQHVRVAEARYEANLAPKHTNI